MRCTLLPPQRSGFSPRLHVFQDPQQKHCVLSLRLPQCLKHWSQVSPSAELQQRFCILGQPEGVLVLPVLGHMLEGVHAQALEQPGARAGGAGGAGAGLQAAGQAALLPVGAEQVGQQGGPGLQEGHVLDLQAPQGRVSDLCAAEELLPLTGVGDQIQRRAAAWVRLLQEDGAWGAAQVHRQIRARTPASVMTALSHTSVGQVEHLQYMMHTTACLSTSLHLKRLYAWFKCCG